MQNPSVCPAFIIPGKSMSEWDRCEEVAVSSSAGIKEQEENMTDEEVAVSLTEHDHEIGSLKHRVDNMENLVHATNELAMSVRELTVNVANNSNQMERYEDRLRAQGERIGELEKKPSKRWDLLMTTIITAIASGVVGFMVSNLF